MNKVYFISFVVCIFVCACTDKEKSKVEIMTEALDSLAEVKDTLILVEDIPVPKAADELFNDFFFNFTTDENFQKSRITFPLNLKDGESAQKIGLNEWNLYDKFHEQEFYSVIYERERDLELLKDTAVNAVKVKWIYMQNEHIVNYYFKKLEGQWLLTGLEKTVMSNSSNYGFLTFYKHFSSDSIYQNASIVFPLKYILSPEGEIEEGEEFELSVEEWDELREQIPVPSDVIALIDYGQASISQNRKVFLVQGISNGLYIKYKFDKNGEGQWQLYEIEN